MYINIYNETDANVSAITRKVREEMGDDDLCLVMANGLQYFDQEGTRGKEIVLRILFLVSATRTENCLMFRENFNLFRIFRNNLLCLILVFFFVG